MSNEILTAPTVETPVEKVEENKPLTIQDLFMKVLGFRAKTMRVGQSGSNKNKKHVTKKKAKQKRKVARVSRKKNRSK